MTPPQTQAEQMASNTARMAALTMDCSEQSLKKTILETLPLTELLAVARAATQGPCRHNSDYKGDNCPLCQAITALKAKGVSLE
jgi:hypothetical protein